MLRKSALSSLGILVHLTGEESFPQRAIGNEADAKFLECRQHFLFGTSGPQRIFALDGGDRLDCMRTADRARNRDSERPKCFTFPA